MPTRPIGHGSVNLSVNAPAAARHHLGKLSFSDVQSGASNSTGDSVREVLVLGTLLKWGRQAALALVEIYEDYYGGSKKLRKLRERVIGFAAIVFGRGARVRQPDAAVRVVEEFETEA